MASITVGAGGTLESPTYEGQLLELCQLLEPWEQDKTSHPTSLDYVTVTHDGAGNTTVSFNFPITASIVGGLPSYAAPEYLETVPFSPGTGGTITAPTAAGYLMELIQRAQIIEAAGAIDRIGGSININSLRFTGTLTIATAITATAGGALQIQAVEYL